MVNLVLRKLRNWLLAGLVVLLPVWLTFFALYWAFTNLDAAIKEPLERWGLPQLAGVGIGLALIVTLLVGWLTTLLVGQQLLSLGDRIMLRVPVVRQMYTAAKQVTEAVLQRKDRAFSQVVLVEYPRIGVYSLGFVAGELPELGLLRLWLPGGPSPAGGPVVMVPVQETVLLPLSVEDGLKIIISAGVLTPREHEIEALGKAVAELRRRRSLIAR